LRISANGSGLERNQIGSFAHVNDTLWAALSCSASIHKPAHTPQVSKYFLTWN
jgi:hypothetical protein